MWRLHRKKSSLNWTPCESPTGKRPNSKEILERTPASSGFFFEMINMVKINTTGLTEYEKNDPLWWCEHHKSTVAILALRLEQLLNGKEDLDKICRVLIENVKERNNLSWEYMEGETGTDPETIR